MSPTFVVLAIVLALLIAGYVGFRRLTRHADGGTADLGVVSARWISELRRDEPWSNS